MYGTIIAFNFFTHLHKSLSVSIFPSLTFKFCQNQLRNMSTFTNITSSTTKIDAEAYKAKSSAELIEIVDINNNILKPTTRGEMREKGLIHRATYAFIRTSNNYFYVQKRSMIKDYCPGYYDPTPGGVVDAGESVDLTNEREIEEEMGITQPLGIERMKDFFYEDERTKCWGSMFDVIYDMNFENTLKLQAEEVDSVQMMTLQEILDKSASGELDITPDGIHATKLYIKEKGLLKAVGVRPEVLLR